MGRCSYSRLALAVVAAGFVTTLGVVGTGAATATTHVRAARPTGQGTIYITHVNGASAPARPILHTVTPIKNGTILRGISVGRWPEAIAITPNGATAYVADTGAPNPGDTVTPIHTATNKAGPAIKVGKSPAAIVITPNGRTAYVANEISGTITPIDTSTNSPGPGITTGSSPYLLAVTPNSKTVYMVNGNSSTVTPIRTATNTAGPPIKVAPDPRAIAITPNGKTVYIVSSESVTPIATATNKPGPAIAVTSDSDAIAITANSKTAYVANGVAGRSPRSPLSRTLTGQPISTHGSPDSLAITPNGKTLYAVNVGDLQRRTARWSRSRPPPTRQVSRLPWATRPIPSRSRRTGRSAYIVNPLQHPPDPGSISKIDTATNKVTATITVPPYPYAIAIAP